MPLSRRLQLRNQATQEDLAGVAVTAVEQDTCTHLLALAASSLTDNLADLDGLSSINFTHQHTAAAIAA